MEYTGYVAPAQSAEVVYRGDVDTREFIAFWLSDGRLLAGMNVNVGGVTDAIEALIHSPEPIDVGQLCDPDVPLEELAARPARANSESTSAAGTGIGKMFTQGMSFARHLVTDRFAKGDPIPIDELPTGEGRVLQVDGQKAAVYRDKDGTVHAASATCTHMGCLVDWNSAEKTWDCPCHGSRFDRNGKVIQGPAKKDLKAIDVNSPKG
jgi:nitrite reductase/ring-hydroxylating ferredoxin subunit